MCRAVSKGWGVRHPQSSDTVGKTVFVGKIIKSVGKIRKAPFVFCFLLLFFFVFCLLLVTFSLAQNLYMLLMLTLIL